jgi:hypothetical protein
MFLNQRENISSEEYYGSERVLYLGCIAPQINLIIFDFN